MILSSINQKIKKILACSLSIAVIFLVWILAAKLINSDLILPGPVQVAKSVGKNLISAVFWKNFSFTFLRVIISISSALLLGFVIGIFCGEFSFFDDFMKFPLTFVRATPVVALILVLLFWFPSNWVPVVISVLMTLPIMISSVKTGIKNVSSEQIFFAGSRGLNRSKILIKIKIPASRINVLEGAVQCFSLSWKVVIAGEVLCLPRFAVGSRIHVSQIHLESADVIANTLILVFFSFFLELIIKRIVKIIELKIQHF